MTAKRCFSTRCRRSLFDKAAWEAGGNKLSAEQARQRQQLWKYAFRHAEFVSRHQWNSCRDSFAAELNSGLLAPLETQGQEGIQDDSLGLLSETVETEGGADGAKLRVQFPDGRSVETVVIIADRKARGASAPTICISSQVSCAMACRFCDTGLLLTAAAGREVLNSPLNLQPWAMVEQVFHAEAFLQRERLLGRTQRANVVFMGMGEPLLNYGSVMEASRMLCSDMGQARQVMLSTVGVAPRIASLPDDGPSTLQLALSLHAPNQALREELLPRAARAWPLPLVMEAVKVYENASGKGVLLEYIMISGINDQDHHAEELATLIHAYGLGTAGVNLIPCNPTQASRLAGYSASSDGRCKEFRRLLRERGVHNVTVRFSTKLGRAVLSACGQLATTTMRTGKKP